jgi:hypothetical protein
MLNIKNVLEENFEIYWYLKKRDLFIQYKKAKNKILSWNYKDLSTRKPKEKWIWYFRINKQFRAYAVLKDGDLIVYEVNNHQNW